jgi:hypothetical protein
VVNHYRFYELDHSDHIEAGYSVECGSDADAVHAAGRLLENRPAAAVEVWQGPGRCIQLRSGMWHRFLRRWNRCTARPRAVRLRTKMLQRLTSLRRKYVFVAKVWRTVHLCLQILSIISDVIVAVMGKTYLARRVGELLTTEQTALTRSLTETGIAIDASVQVAFARRYEVVTFSAWKYRRTPELWVYLYETVANACMAGTPPPLRPELSRAATRTFPKMVRDVTKTMGRCFARTLVTAIAI